MPTGIIIPTVNFGSSSSFGTLYTELEETKIPAEFSMVRRAQTGHVPDFCSSFCSRRVGYPSHQVCFPLLFSLREILTRDLIQAETRFREHVGNTQPTELEE